AGSAAAAFGVLDIAEVLEGIRTALKCTRVERVSREHLIELHQRGPRHLNEAVREIVATMT
ncbi:MAG TPA: hypothetical protein VET25_02480, partial [Aestuariivirgaceae bacterium]|nr:hypothetical protein [Aestuariivirgaceae bacterium]